MTQDFCLCIMEIYFKFHCAISMMNHVGKESIVIVTNTLLGIILTSFLLLVHYIYEINTSRAEKLLQERMRQSSSNMKYDYFRETKMILLHGSTPQLLSTNVINKIFKTAMMLYVC